MSNICVTPDSGVPGVVRIAKDNTFPRPHIGVVGALHGNEPCGLRAIERIQAELEAGDLRLNEGTLVLIHGNPAATGVTLRYTEDGADLNRLFDFEFENQLRAEYWSPEHHRAVALRPIFENLDAALDIHSAAATSPPFVITTRSPKSAEIARNLGQQWITRGWEDLNLLSGKVFIELLTRQGKPSIAVECGQHDDPSTFTVAYDCAKRYLMATGILEGRLENKPAKMLNVICVVEKPTKKFRFSTPIKGLDHLESGHRIGTDGEIALHIDNASYILLPNDKVPVGADMLYLARIDRDWVA